MLCIKGIPMSLAWFPPSETDHDFGKRELSAYEQYLEEQRQQRELEKQLRKYGDDAMRVDPQMSLRDAASSIPTEPFTRAYQMRMPGSKVEKPDSKDPLRSLMKAMKIDVTKTRETQTGDARGARRRRGFAGSADHLRPSLRPLETIAETT